MEVIDCHTHLTKQPVLGRGSLDGLRRAMREARISRALIISEAISTSYWYSSRELASLLDHESLRLIAGLNLHANLAAQLRHVRQLISKRLVCGLKLYAGYQYFYPADPRLEPVYALAREEALPIVIHCGDLFNEGADRPPLLKYSHPLHVDEAAALHPQVNFIIAHCGNPWIVDCAEVMMKNKNVYADVSGLVYERLDRRERNLVARRLEDAFTFLGGPERFLFGSDWPIVELKPYLNFFRGLIPRKDQELFFHGNAESLFGL